MNSEIQTHPFLKIWFEFLAKYAEDSEIFLDIDDYQNAPQSLINKLEDLFTKSIHTIFEHSDTDGITNAINQASLDALSILVEYANHESDKYHFAELIENINFCNTYNALNNLPSHFS